MSQPAVQRRHSLLQRRRDRRGNDRERVCADMRDFEIVAVDNNSTDRTAEVLAGIAERRAAPADRGRTGPGICRRRATPGSARRAADTSRFSMPTICSIRDYLEAHADQSREMASVGALLRAHPAGRSAGPADRQCNARRRCQRADAPPICCAPIHAPRWSSCAARCSTGPADSTKACAASRTRSGCSGSPAAGVEVARHRPGARELPHHAGRAFRTTSTRCWPLTVRCWRRPPRVAPDLVARASPAVARQPCCAIARAARSTTRRAPRRHAGISGACCGGARPRRARAAADAQDDGRRSGCPASRGLLRQRARTVSAGGA